MFESSPTGNRVADRPKAVSPSARSVALLGNMAERERREGGEGAVVHWVKYSDLWLHFVPLAWCSHTLSSTRNPTLVLNHRWIKPSL